MSSRGSVSYWLERLKAGDAAAAQPLWECYFQRLVGLARQKLLGAPRRAADEEDVALSAFDSFCRRAEAGRFPRLHDRDDLWRLLVTLTTHKAVDLRRHEARHKRGSREAGAAAPPSPSGSPWEADELEQQLSREPTPAFAAQVAEECQRLLGRLTEPSLRAVALAKMEGYTNAEIAAQLGCGLRSIERKLQVIRGLWIEELPP
jgi:DNA-directed RNA polymerase specialized sigma24 family protein